MKNKHTILILGLFIVIGFLLSNCASSKNGLLDRIKVREDIVHSTKRITFKHTHKFFFSRTPLLSMDQTFVKTIRENNKSVINVYDRLRLKPGEFKVQDSVYMIVKNKVYHVVPKLFERERLKYTSSSKKKITTSDHETASVITGYNEKDRNIVRVKYQLTEPMISAFETADTVSFRYYAGPYMMTVDIKEEVLEAVKHVINGNFNSD